MWLNRSSRTLSPALRKARNSLLAGFMSQQPLLSKAIAAVANNNVVKHPNVQQRQSVFDAHRNALVRGTGYRLTAGMVVCLM